MILKLYSIVVFFFGHSFNPSCSFCILFKNIFLKKKHAEKKTKQHNKKKKTKQGSGNVWKKEGKPPHLSHTLWLHRSSTLACFRSFNPTRPLIPAGQTTSRELCGRPMPRSLSSSTTTNRWGLEGMKEIRDEGIKLKDGNREAKVRESWDGGARCAEAQVNRLEKENRVMRSKKRCS